MELNLKNYCGLGTDIVVHQKASRAPLTEDNIFEGNSSGQSQENLICWYSLDLIGKCL